MPGPDQIDRRVTRLEESALFSDRAVDDLSIAVRELVDSMGRLESRLARIEARLDQVESGAGHEDPGLEPPPHSAGPDISRDPL